MVSVEWRKAPVTPTLAREVSAVAAMLAPGVTDTRNWVYIRQMAGRKVRGGSVTGQVYVAPAPGIPRATAQYIRRLLKDDVTRLGGVVTIVEIK